MPVTETTVTLSSVYICSRLSRAYFWKGLAAGTNFVFLNFVGLPFGFGQEKQLDLKARPNRRNLLMEHRPTLLKPTCCTRSAAML